MTQMFITGSVDTRNCLGTMEHRACQRKIWCLHLPEWYRLSLRVRRRLPRRLALVPGLEDPPEGPVDGSPALLRTARTDTQSVLLHHNSTQTDRQSHASHMLGSPYNIQPSSEPDLHYYLAVQTILKTMHYLNTWYTNQFNNQQWTNSLPEAWAYVHKHFKLYTTK